MVKLLSDHTGLPFEQTPEDGFPAIPGQGGQPFPPGMMPPGGRPGMMMRMGGGDAPEQQKQNNQKPAPTPKN